MDVFYKIFVIIKILTVAAESDLSKVNSKNISFNSAILRFINERRFDENLVKNVEKNTGVVNNYEEITVLEDGELRNLKFKTARPMVPVKLIVRNESDVTESEMTKKHEKLDKTKSKFFEELGRKYLLLLDLNLVPYLDGNYLLLNYIF